MNWQKFRLSLNIVLVVITTSCIERFYIAGPEEKFVPKMVINGTITTDKDLQEIVISMTSTPEDPKFVPVSGCNVQVEDDKNNRYFFQETGKPGHYYGVIQPNVLVPGSQFRLNVLTPEGKYYSSKLEKLLPCPEVGSVYYEILSKPTTDPELVEDGLQFYVDFAGDENSETYFRMKLEETYEYHSTWPVQRYLDEQNNFVKLSKADYTKFVCYKTDEIDDIYTLSTLGLSMNKYKHYPLHFVNDKTQRLMFKYSLLIKQYSLTEQAYQYWEALRKNNKEAVDLFGKQPAQVKGNIFNVNDSSEHVLGYFGVSSLTTKRIIVPAATGFSFNMVSFCHVTKPDGESMLPDERPLYYAMGIDENGEIFWNYSDSECFICTLLGGTTAKPTYWETK